MRFGLVKTPDAARYGPSSMPVPEVKPTTRVNGRGLRSRHAVGNWWRTIGRREKRTTIARRASAFTADCDDREAMNGNG